MAPSGRREETWRILELQGSPHLGVGCHPWQCFICRIDCHQCLSPLLHIRRGSRKEGKGGKSFQVEPGWGSLPDACIAPSQGRWSHPSVWRSWRMTYSSQRMGNQGPSPGGCSLLTCLPRASWTAPSAACSSSLSRTAMALGFDPPARKTRLPRLSAQLPRARVSCCLVG